MQLGTVLLAPRLSHRIFAAFAFLATTSLMVLLCFGEYPRKAHISGWLVPEHGLVRVFAPQAGIVTKISVEEGAEVHKGDPLLTLSAEVESATLGATQAEIARNLTSQRGSLERDRLALERLGAQQKRALADRLTARKAEQGKLDSEIALQASLLGYAERSASRQHALQREGLASEQQAQAADESALGQRAKLRELERMRLTAEGDRLELEGDLKDFPLKSVSRMSPGSSVTSPPWSRSWRRSRRGAESSCPRPRQAS